MDEQEVVRPPDALEAKRCSCERPVIERDEDGDAWCLTCSRLVDER